jgi:hypothetical protein
VLVEVDQPAQPAGARRHADEDEQGAGLHGAPGTGPVGDGDGLQPLLAVQFADLGAGHDVHVGDPRDLVDEVPGHVLGQVRLTDDEGDLGGVPGQEDRRLPGRVTAADDRDRVSAAQQRLGLRRRVVDAHLLEVVRARHVEPAVPDPGSDDHRRGGQRAAVAEVHPVVAVVLLDGGGLGGHREPGAELPRLQDRPVRELGAGDARWEPEVVLDA